MSKYINNLDDCSLEVFRLCMMREKYELLHVSGVLNEEEAKEAWFNLYDLYSDSVQSKSNDINLELKKQIHVKSNEKTIITQCLFMITEISRITALTELIKASGADVEFEHDIDDYIKIINQYGFKFDKENLVESIERVQRQIKNYDTRIQSDIKKIENIEKNSKKWTFDDTINSVAKFMGFQINKKETSMTEFVSMVNMVINEPKDNGK